MAELTERVTRLESDIDSSKKSIDDHEHRLRKLERLTFGTIAAAIVLSWVITQANSLAKLFS